MWSTPSSTARRTTAMASARSRGGPKAPGPGSCIAPNPTRRTDRPANRNLVSSAIKTRPGPVRYRQPGRYRRRIREHVAHRPLHVRPQGRPELGVLGQAGVLDGLPEAGDEPVAQIGVGTLALTRMDAEHPRMSAAGLRIARRAAEDLGPVARQ